MIRWHRLDPAAVERAVKMLIVELHIGAQAIDGAGGDDGQDHRWDSPDGLVILEVKSYSSRLTSSQKRKIKKSLDTAAAHAPLRWELMMPLDPSPVEMMWFTTLRGQNSTIELVWRDQAWLDSHFARREYLRRMVEGSEYALLEPGRGRARPDSYFAGVRLP